MATIDDIINHLNDNDPLKGKNIPKRTGSKIGENDVKDEIKAYCNIVNKQCSILPEDAYAELELIDNGIIDPANVKLTKCKTPDNTNCKSGIFYVLTGKLPQAFGISNATPYPLLLKILFDNIDLTDKNISDYYFIVYNKDSNRYFWSSLRNINEAIPNGSNLPFQIHWGKEFSLGRKYKNTIDTSIILLKAYYESFSKRAEPLNEIKKYITANGQLING